MPQENKVKEPKRAFAVNLYGWLQALVGVQVTAILLFVLVGPLTWVDGDSMRPTLSHGD